jgi:hypothetical protein
LLAAVSAASCGGEVSEQAPSPAACALPGGHPDFTDFRTCARIVSQPGGSPADPCTTCCVEAGFFAGGFVEGASCACVTPQLAVNPGVDCAEAYTTTAECVTCCSSLGYAVANATPGDSCSCRLRRNSTVCACALQSDDLAGACAGCCFDRGTFSHEWSLDPPGCACLE